MLIRSQDKLSLVPHDIGVLLIVGSDIRIISMNNENMYGLLGHYSTEAKAIKVLDMIQSQYETERNTNYAADFGVYASKLAGNIQYLHTFQMPSDEEVEG
jgi:hypothetical protein